MMEAKLTQFARRYFKTLVDRLDKSVPAEEMAAVDLGRRALALGLWTLDIARIHEIALAKILAVGSNSKSERKIVLQATAFFAAAVRTIEEPHYSGLLASQLRILKRELQLRTLALTTSRRRLKAETACRVGVEVALRKSEQHHGKSLAQSRDLQQQLRQLSHQILSVQEEERKRISRELHDQIVQTLTGINLRLAHLNAEAAGNTKDLQKKIASTQYLVERSVQVVHRFARDLRPTVLDDLGLIPALHSFMKDLKKRTGISIDFTALRSEWIEHLDGGTRTVLYRVAQEALTNIERHAHASHVKVTLQKLSRSIQMTITDDGKGFNVQHVRIPKPHHRLGILGMRERLQMVGGRFIVESTPGSGTTIRAQIPISGGQPRAKARD